MPAGVVVDVNAFVHAVTNTGGPRSFSSWPSPPPEGPNAPADCIGIFNDAQEFCLWISPHILSVLVQVLILDYAWKEELARRCTHRLVWVAKRSGGGVIRPQTEVGDCEDYEDNRILELAMDSGAILIVSDDHHLTEMSPWRGIPVVTARAFRDRASAARRLRRTRGG
jgi:predicted nucleic acid-binding protein